MIEKQLVERGITNERILNAFLKVKRHMFVKKGLREKAYNDSPLDIGEGQVINRPYIVAMMTYVIAPDYNKKVLEVGTGSGYHAAILAELVEQVFTIEIEEKLAEKARKKLLALGYNNINFKIGDGSLGWAEHGPFDGIICTYSPDHIPPRLLEQLAIGGRMIVEVSHSSKVQEFILIEKDNKGTLKKTNLIPVQFKPIIRGKNEK
ncbi:MAG: protein-L-isoaspartate(D-aspartate) O-methyltransferase [Candidatus Aminicenantes bacterium]|nr:protein-L-isoaspartate(D-aspartate) O-methyltransferase [Candidatus Aminicenantes bacterium]